MKLNGLIYRLTPEVRKLIASFVIVLSTGYLVAIMLVHNTSSLNPKGIQTNYLGNEKVLNTDVMKFKKSTYQIYNSIHTHIISMAIIFFIIGLLLAITDLNYKLKFFLIIEPFVSIVLTFGGIYLLWCGIIWMKYLIFVSSIVMAIVFFISSSIILYQSISSKKT